MEKNPQASRVLAAAVWKGRRFLRRLFGAPFLPQWVKDLLAATPFSKLVLVWTFVAIATAPERFFALTDPIRASKRKFYATPISFFLTSALLLLGLRLTAKHSFGLAITSPTALETAAGIALLLLAALASPLLMLIFCVVALWLCGPLSQLGIDIRSLLVPLDFQAYERMNYRRFGWNLLYFGIFCIVAVPVTSALMVLQFMATANSWSRFVVLPVTAFLLIGFVMRPYGALLKNSVHVPTFQMLFNELESLRGYLLTPAIKASTDRDVWQKLVVGLSIECTRLAKVEAKLRRRAARSGEVWVYALQFELAKVYTMTSLEQIEWLASWGPGSSDERAQLGTCLTFIRGHTKPDESTVKLPLAARPLTVRGAAIALVVITVLVLAFWQVLLFLVRSG